MPRIVVHDPAGRLWTVERHWAPRVVPDGLSARWRRRRRERRSGDGGDSWFDALDLGGFADDPITAVLGIVALSVVALLWLLLLASGVLPLLLGVVDLALFVVLLPLYVLTRVLLRRPWVVEVRSGDLRRDFPVVGWRRAGQVRDDLAALLSAGTPLGDLPAPS